MRKNIFKKIIWKISLEFFPIFGPHRHLMNKNPNYIGFKIGDKSYGNPKILFSNNETTLEIGKFVSIADDVVIMLGGEHRTDWVTTYPLNEYFKKWTSIKGHPATKGNVIIGNDVWIGREALILSGVTIGDGAVIGAKALVTKDVMPYSIVAGNPAKHIRYRFDADIVAKLTELKWWNWSDSIICKSTPFLLSNDMNSLLEFSKKMSR
jgi:acetyltransferase-like isoleucine patch superfamily enzyme